MTTREETGIEVHTGFLPLAFLLYLCTPRIEIDGTTYKQPWGTRFFPLPPGRHTVRIYFPYLFMPHCGDNRVTVSLDSGQVRWVNFHMPPLMFLKGSMKVQ